MVRVFSQTFCVAGAIIERNGKILLVREAQIKGPDHGKWSHPAGWVDVGENPIDAIKREVKEETGFDFTPKHVLGIYSLVRKDIERNGYNPHPIKIIFIGEISEIQNKNTHDDVSEAKWFLPEEIYNMDQATLRDIDIKQMVKDYINGNKFSLDAIIHTVSIK